MSFQIEKQKTSCLSRDIENAKIIATQSNPENFKVEPSDITEDPQNNYEKLNCLDLKAHFYFNSKKSCIDHIFLDTLYSIVQMEKFSSKQSQDDLISFCQKEGQKYSNTTNFLSDLGALIKDIESKEIETNAIKWYTKDTFLYRMINNVFREGEYTKIFNKALSNLKRR